jgi:hypothetical protein
MPGVETVTARRASIATSVRGEADARAAADEQGHVAGHRPDHLLATRTERHADPDFARPPRHGKGDDGVESDADQAHAERSERTEKRSDRLRAPSDSSRYCAIVFAEVTGSEAFTARSSRCIVPTRPAASSDVRATTAVGSRSHDAPAGIGKRLPTKEGCVNQTEDRGLGADAEAQNRDGRDREAPVAEKPADTGVDVARQRIGLIAHVFRW